MNKRSGQPDGLDTFLPVVEAVVNHIDEGVIVADANGQVLYHNEAARLLLGIPPSQILRETRRLGGINLHKLCQTTKN